jgi:hypothetical protein
MDQERYESVEIDALIVEHVPDDEESDHGDHDHITHYRPQNPSGGMRSTTPLAIAVT